MKEYLSFCSSCCTCYCCQVENITLVFNLQPAYAWFKESDPQTERCSLTNEALSAFIDSLSLPWCLRWDYFLRLQHIHRSSKQRAGGMQSKYRVFWRNKTLLIYDMSKRINVWELRWNQGKNKWNATGLFPHNSFSMLISRRFIVLSTQPVIAEVQSWIILPVFVLHISMKDISSGVTGLGVAPGWAIWCLSHHHNNVSPPPRAPSPWSPLTHDKHTKSRLERDEPHAPARALIPVTNLVTVSRVSFEAEWRKTSKTAVDLIYCLINN